MPAVTYDENYGELPTSLYRAIKANNVSPSDFQTLECYDLGYNEMRELILANSPNGNFQLFTALGLH